MAQHSQKGFYARMLGGFVLCFQSQEIAVPMRLQSKSMQLLLQLLKAEGEGIERNDLVNLFQRDCYDRQKQINNFYQQIYLLRRAIKRAGFPAGEYIVLKGSRYYFTLDYPVETDTGSLDRILLRIQDRNSEADSVSRKKLLLEFCRTYTGEFLPMLSGEEWVNMESACYHKWYARYLKQLCEMLKQEGSYEEMLELCAAASQMHPYDEWQMMQIDCLMSMNRYEEAMRIYEETAQMLFEELGIPVNDQAISRYRSISSRLSYTANTLNNVMEHLQEPENLHGPYYCSYPSFLDIYHVLSRIGERAGTKMLLLICTLKRSEAGQASGGKPEAKDQGESEGSSLRGKLKPEMEQFCQVLDGGIRNGDVYTRYSANQFLMLLIGADQADGLIIIRRLQDRWSKIQNGGTAVNFTAYVVEGSAAEEDGNENGKEGNLHDIYHKSGECHLAGAGNLAE